MFCPRCGQQQISEEIKFCSRCGLPLGLAAEIVASGGNLPANLAVDGQPAKLLTRANAFKFGLAWFLVLTFLLTPLAAVLHLRFIVPLFGVLGFMGGILIMVLSMLFLPKTGKVFGAAPGAVENYAPAPLAGRRAAPGALPPPTSMPVSDYAPPAAGSWKAPDTGDLVPNSVTEGTTRLFTKGSIGE